jgi:hypothetical protein
MVEPQPSKLVVRVRFPSPALFAAVAQLVERVLGKDEVMSSSLISSFQLRFIFKIVSGRINRHG